MASAKSVKKAKKVAPKGKKASARKAATKKPVSATKAALKKRMPLKKKAAANKPSRFCLGKCSCGSPCTYDSGHTGSHYCSFHAPNS